MNEAFVRTAMLLGEDGMERLANARVAVFGVGGVGGFACEALARAGVGRLLLVDDDTVSESNLNRQIVALRSTVGRAKVDVMAERIRDIDPAIAVETRQCFFSEENADTFDFSAFSSDTNYICDNSTPTHPNFFGRTCTVPMCAAEAPGKPWNGKA